MIKFKNTLKIGFRSTILTQVFALLFLSTTVIRAQETTIYPDTEWEYEIKPCPCVNKFVVDSLNTTGLMLIKGGKVIYEYGDVKDISYLASTRKSILSMLYGIYVEKGDIDLTATLEELNVDDNTPLTSEEKKATVDNIINARSGVYLPAANSGSAPNRPKRGAHAPGTHFYYNNWDYNVAGTIFEKQTGMNIFKAFEQNLAIPLGFQDFDLDMHRKSGDTSKSIHQAYHFHLSTRDMARIGYLMLRDGKWKNNQIIPSKWVNKITTKVSDTERGNLLNGYSYMWWIFDSNKYPELEGAFTATGMWGQYITIIPKLDLVVAHKTRRVYRRSTQYEDYEKLLIRIIEQETEKTNGKVVIDEYVGFYQISENAVHPVRTIELFVENNELKLKSTQFPNGEIFNIGFCSPSEVILRMPGQPVAIVNFNKEGQIISLEIQGTKYIRNN